MKKLFSIICLFLFSANALFANTGERDNINFSDLVVVSDYNETTRQITAVVLLETNVTPTRNYYVELRVSGREVEERFFYDSNTDIFSSDFSIVLTSQPTNTLTYSLRITDSRNTSYYIKNGVIGDNSDTPIGEPIDDPITDPLTSSERAEVLRLLDTVFDSIPSSLTTSSQKQMYIDDIIDELEIYVMDGGTNSNIIIALIIELEDITFNSSPVNPTGTFTPMYSSQSEEPYRINGIGNNRNYKSWRAEDN